MKIRMLKSEDWNWVYSRAYPVLCQDTVGLVAEGNSNLLAAVVMDSWAPNSCLAHIVIENPFVLRHGFLEEVFHYAFVTRGRGLMTGLTPANNHKALRFNRHIGLRETYRIPNGYRKGIDYVFQEMNKGECRWLPDKLREVA